VIQKILDGVTTMEDPGQVCYLHCICLCAKQIHNVTKTAMAFLVDCKSGLNNSFYNSFDKTRPEMINFVAMPWLEFLSNQHLHEFALVKC
jgi:hypothetical protein